MTLHAVMPWLALLVLVTSFDTLRLRAEPPKTSNGARGETTVSAKNSEGGANVDETLTHSIIITAAESAEHGLPAVEISLDTGDNGMSGRKFRQKNEYLSLSGPPGGPLGLKVIHVATVPANEAQWRTLVEECCGEKPLELGATGEVEIAGGKRQAHTYTTGVELRERAHHLLIVVPVPETKEGILVQFYRRAGESKTPAPKELAQDSKFADILRTLTFNFE